MKKLPLLLTCLVLLSACQKTQKNSNEEQTETEQAVAEEDTEREPNDDEIREYGLITAIEDSGYPMFSIDVEFPERQTSASFSFNVEASPLDAAQLEAVKGKYATIYYEVVDDPTIESILRDCDPVWGVVSPDSNGIKEINGILSGAESISGDLPGTLVITTDDGRQMKFEHFIEEEVLAVNNTEVTVFYYENSRQTITYLRASED